MTTQELTDALAAAMAKTIDTSYRREKGSIALDATGAGQGIVRASRLYDMVCERITATAAAGAIIQFFENSTQPSDLLEAITVGASGLYSDAFSNKLLVPAGSQLLVVVTGGGANLAATYNLQIQLVRTDQ